MEHESKHSTNEKQVKTTSEESGNYYTEKYAQPSPRSHVCEQEHGSNNYNRHQRVHSDSNTES